MSTEPLNCRSCAAGITAANRFCPACGELYPAMTAAEATATPLQEIADDVAGLVQEKARLGAELEQLASQGGERELTAEERAQWARAYTRWRDVASDITLLVNRIHPRGETDRRAEADTPPPNAERRSREDRRDPFWTRAP
jgi:hypothetical protein